MIVQDGAVTEMPISAPLFDGFGSGVSASKMVEKLIIVPIGADGSTVTISVKSAVSPDAMPDVVQVINPVPPSMGVEQLQPIGAISDLKVVCSGTSSLSVMLSALLGPALATWIS